MKRVLGGSLNLILVNSKSITTNRHYSACALCKNYLFSKRIPGVTQNIQKCKYLEYDILLHHINDCKNPLME